jgi:serine protease AprX
MKLSRHLHIIVFSLFIFCGRNYSQDSLPRYWISFTDKINTPYSVERPLDFLSQRAINRRIRQHIPITVEDLPVDPAYTDSLSKLGLQVINVSKWFNGTLVATNDDALIDSIDHLGFVDGQPILVRPVITDKTPVSKISREKNSTSLLTSPYGYSSSQIEMLHGDYFHRQGIEGEGMLIAILDAGFENANSVSSLAHIWQDNRLLATKDFVKDSFDIFNSHLHGTLVFSIIAGIEEGILYGSAPAAEFALIRTEDGGSEYLIEEYNWLCGAEYADSLGADIINSSLGYALFDDSLQNHTYADLDGKTNPVSIAAHTAASKGIVVVASAGNEGNKAWHHIISPADAENIITVGAVDSLGIITPFSSRGPSSDQRIKPDVCSQGLFTVGQYPNGSFHYTAGTSCSAPLISGMAACLWQSNPSANYLDIIKALQKAGDQYFNPDSLYGYGIPDLTKSDRMLANSLGDSLIDLPTISLFPNPAHSSFYLNLYQQKESVTQLITISIFDIQGRLCYQENRTIESDNFILYFSDMQKISKGLNMVRINLSGKSLILPLIKI